MKSLRPEIFSYHEYQVFLKDWLAYRKVSQSTSLRDLAKQAGLASGYLPMVLSGKRPLSSAALAKIMPYLGLNLQERTFLTQLVILGTSDSQDLRVAALEKMKRSGQFQKLNPGDAEAYDYLSHWYYVAIREMATLREFREDAIWIQERLRFTVTLKEVKEALSFLLEKGFLERGTDKRIRPPEKELDCRGGIYRLALGKFHKEALDLAAKSIDKVPSVERHLAFHTCALSPSSFAKAKEIAEEAIQKIRALGQNEASGDAVYHMEVALFPLTQKIKGSK